jgi:hypothetical protein
MPPERGGSATSAPAAADSILTLVATIPFSSLSHLADQKLPQSQAIGGDGHIGCVDVPYVNPGHVGSHEECFNKPYLDFRGAGTERVCVQVPDVVGPNIGTHRQCADYHWHADIQREGGASISRNGQFLRLSQGIHVTGQAGVGGSLAQILSLQGKNIDIHATPRVDLSATLDQQWCPVVSVNPVGSWVDDAFVEVVGKNCLGVDLGALGHPEVCAGPANIGIAGPLNQELDKHRDELQMAAQTAISCGPVKAQIASQWHAFALRVDQERLPPLYLNIIPRSVSFSGIVPEDNRLRVTVRVGAQTILAASPADMAVQVLPPLQPLNSTNGGLQINLQAIGPYDLLKQQLRQSLAGQTFQKEVAGRKIEVRITDVDLYPSKGSLALGLQIDAEMPGRWFNTKGWVYLVGKPTVSKDGRSVKVTDIQFAAVVDNAFWSTAEKVLQGDILKTLNERATFDFSEEIDKATRNVSQAIAKAAVPGLKITAGLPQIALDGVHVTGSDLVVSATMSISVEAEVTEAIFR